MTYEKITREFDHLQYIPLLQRMYDNNSVEEIKDHATSSQVRRFRKEMETLSAFGLHKELEIVPDSTKDEKTAARKFSDGKVDAIFSVSNAKIKEIYRDSNNKKRYRRKIKNAFIESTAVKTNKNLSYNEENPPHCINCGGEMEIESENYFCPYCRTHYKAEAYKYLISRFFIEEVFHNFRYLWIFFGPVIVLGILQAAGFLDEKQGESIILILATPLAILLTFLFFYSLIKGLRNFFRHKAIIRKIRKFDPNFSEEITRLRLNDLLSMHPESLITEEKEAGETSGIICRNVVHMEFRSYQRQDDLEIIKCFVKADALFLKGQANRVRLKDKYKKFTVYLKRTFGTFTPLHYLPDQYTCHKCGSHQMTEDEGMQVCSFCHTKQPMESIDRVLAEN
jgi:Zn finger protein HypA/HybF involved in hydrogenase expression